MDTQAAYEEQMKQFRFWRNIGIIVVLVAPFVIVKQMPEDWQIPAFAIDWAVALAAGWKVTRAWDRSRAYLHALRFDQTASTGPRYINAIVSEPPRLR